MSKEIAPSWVTDSNRKTLARHTTQDSYSVFWQFDGERHFILYGEQVKIFPLGKDIAACREYGECVRHSLECAGLLDGTE